MNSIIIIVRFCFWFGFHYRREIRFRYSLSCLVYSQTSVKNIINILNRFCFWKTFSLITRNSRRHVSKFFLFEPFEHIVSWVMFGSCISLCWEVCTQINYDLGSLLVMPSRKRFIILGEEKYQNTYFITSHQNPSVKNVCSWWKRSHN